ncbi:MAG TPA: hypothetical protein VI670_11350, partial [Thermoanaerobaculia bacterium]
MTAQTLDRVTLADSGPQKKEYAVEKPRVPLVWKLFGLTALLIVIVVGVAVGITIERANRIANETVRTSINGAAKLFRSFEEQRLGRLEGVTSVLGSDSNFYAYIQTALNPAPEAATPSQPSEAPAPAGIDYSSINDTLLEQRDRLKTDVMLLLDDQGVLVARTDKPMVAGGTKEDFYAKFPLVKHIVDEESVPNPSGVL